jgi:hypothetical protein
VLSIEVLQLVAVVHRVFLGLQTVAEDFELQVEAALILLRILHSDVAELEGLLHILVLIGKYSGEAGYLSEEGLLSLAVAILEERSTVALYEELPVLAACGVV